MLDEQTKELFRNDTMEELSRLYYETIERQRKESNKRTALIIAGFVIFHFIVLSAIGHIDSFAAFVAIALVSFLSGAIHFAICHSIFVWYCVKNQEENEYKKFLEDRIEACADRQKDK